MQGVTMPGGQRRGLRAFWASLSRGQKRAMLMMIAVVGGLHVAGFLTLISLVAPRHYELGRAGAFTIVDRRDRVHARVAARFRCRSHRGDRQHHTEADVRGQAPVECRVLVLVVGTRRSFSRSRS